MDVAGGQNGPGGLRYASEETVAELTKEEKVSVGCRHRVGARRLTEMLIPFHRALLFFFLVLFSEQGGRNRIDWLSKILGDVEWNIRLM